MRVIVVIGLFVALSASCGGESNESGSRPDETAKTADDAALQMSSLCEQYSNASAAKQRAFAERARNDEQTVAEAVQFLNTACGGNGALTISEAIGQAVAEDVIEEAEDSTDPYADTRIHGSLAAEIARSIKESWNRCDDNDVCIPGETALAVGCRQPDPQVKELSCFVTTERGAGGEDSGYSVRATVSGDSYSWRLDSG